MVGPFLAWLEKGWTHLWSSRLCCIFLEPDWVSNPSQSFNHPIFLSRNLTQKKWLDFGTLRMSISWKIRPSLDSWPGTLWCDAGISNTLCSAFGNWKFGRAFWHPPEFVFFPQFLLGIWSFEMGCIYRYTRINISINVIIYVRTVIRYTVQWPNFHWPVGFFWWSASGCVTGRNTLATSHKKWET